jgi:hypothetical protein
MTSKLIEGMSNADYHAHPAVSSSQIKTMWRSALHFWAEYIDPEREEEETSNDAYSLGSLVHTLFLEPHLFESEYLVLPENAPSRPTSAQLNAKKPSEDSVAKIAWWAEFDEKLAGRTLITADQLKAARRMVKQANLHPFASGTMQEYAEQSRVEVSIFFEDPDTGVECRIRPDWCLPPCEKFPNGLILDLKTTDDARSEAFARSCTKFGYDISSAMYVDGFQQYFQTEAPPNFLFLVVEKDPPHATACYYAGPTMLDVGRHKLSKCLAELAKCQHTQVWPGYSPLIAPIELPAWAAKASML